MRGALFRRAVPSLWPISSRFSFSPYNPARQTQIQPGSPLQAKIRSIRTQCKARGTPMKLCVSLERIMNLRLSFIHFWIFSKEQVSRKTKAQPEGWAFRSFVLQASLISTGTHYPRHSVFDGGWDSALPPQGSAGPPESSSSSSIALAKFLARPPGAIMP